MKKMFRFIFITFGFWFFIASNLWAATIYVDNSGCGDCADYRVTERDCGSGSETVYDTIQEAITNCSVGDTIYMRAGTYTEIDIDIPETKNGTAWTAGNFTTLCSYPGEWAKIDGTGLNTGSSMFNQSVIRHPTEYGVDDSDNTTAYWKFERFEVTGGRCGFFLKGAHLWFRYLYIHDNGRDAGDTIVAGILMPIPRDCIIEYCYIADNIQPTPSNNNSNILFEADYRDTSGNGGAFDSSACIKNNIIRYNYLKGSRFSMRQKNQQRFGYNDRNPNGMTTYEDWGDKIHHNIILDNSQSIVVGQDFCQVYNNITDSVIDCGRGGDVPQTYNYCVYNNTVIGTGNSYRHPPGYNASYDNYYDSGGQRTVHPHIWYYNNISDSCDSGWHNIPWIICWDMPESTDNPNWDMSDLVLENNFIHEASQNDTFLVGHNYSSGYSGCDYQAHTTSEFNGCSATWRSVSSVTNWENDNSGLFQGASGADQYKTNGNFLMSASKTIASGGIGVAHPYLTGVTLPSYVGATGTTDSGLNWDPDNPDPNDSGWVDYVLNVVNTVGPPHTVKSWKMKSVVKP